MGRPKKNTSSNKTTDKSITDPRIEESVIPKDTYLPIVDNTTNLSEDKTLDKSLDKSLDKELFSPILTNEKIMGESIPKNSSVESLTDSVIDSIPSEEFCEETTNESVNESISYPTDEPTSYCVSEPTPVLTDEPVEEQPNDNSEKFILTDTELSNILLNQIENYKLSDLKRIFYNFSSSVVLFQIINGQIKFIEKKGLSNQSVVDMIIKTNNYRTLPSVQFLVSTSDYINDVNAVSYPYLMTFSKTEQQNSSLFPNFMFNDFESTYISFLEKQVIWSNKYDKIFNFSNIDKINDVYDTIYNVDSLVSYKYIINTYGSNMLPHSFLSGACVIIIENENSKNLLEEHYYKYFVEDEDYIYIRYNDSDTTESLINKITEAVGHTDCYTMAKSSFKKALDIFNKESIYDYIFDIITYLSHKNEINEQDLLTKSIFYVSGSDNLLMDRLSIIQNTLNFNFQGQDLEIHIYNDKDEDDKIILQILNDNTTIHHNKIEIHKKYTPMIVSNLKSQNYEISIKDGNLNMVIEGRFNLIKTMINNKNFIIKKVFIKTMMGGWFIN